MATKEEFLAVIDGRIKEAVLDHADQHGWFEGWDLEWRMDDAEIIVQDEISICTPRNSPLTRWMAAEMARRFYRGGRLAAAFNAALERAV